MSARDTEDASSKPKNWGPHDRPGDIDLKYVDGVTFWTREGQAYAFGHKVAAICPCGEKMDRVWIESEQALCFECEHDDHGITIHPFSTDPATWEVFVTYGVTAEFEGETEWGYSWTTTELDDDPEFTVQVPGLLKDCSKSGCGNYPDAVYSNGPFQEARCEEHASGDHLSVVMDL